MRRSGIRWPRLGLGVATALGLIVIALGFQQAPVLFENDFYTIDGGGGTLLAGDPNAVLYELSGTIGQPDATASISSVDGQYELVGGFWGGPDADPQPVLYVKWDATGVNDGSDWVNAFNRLQTALDVARTRNSDADPLNDVVQIWVARGTYRPDQTETAPFGSNDRTASFALVDGVQILGGFAGTEQTPAERPAVNPADAGDPAVATILSGDLGALGNPADDSLHVVTAAGTGPLTRLDRVTIARGNADQPGQDSGAGLLVAGGVVQVVNCTFWANQAAASGAGAFVFATAAADFVNCRFLGNTAFAGGGVMVAGDPNQPATSTWVNCEFSGNVASAADGGGMLVASGATATVVNCTFSLNVAPAGQTGGLLVDGGQVAVANSIFWQNSDSGGSTETAQVAAVSGSVSVRFSDVMNLTSIPGPGNIAGDPLFRDADGLDDLPGDPGDDLALGVSSPAIDAGENDSVPPDATDLDGDGDTTEPTPLDLLLAERFVNDPIVEPDPGSGTPPIVDMGAREFVDCNGNGIPDDIEVQDPANDCNGDGVPDDCLGGLILASWTGQAGNTSWNDPNNWCPPAVPNNNSPQAPNARFDVTIGTDAVPAPTVRLDISPTLSALTLRAGSTLEVSTPDRLSINVSAPSRDSENFGLIRVANTGGGAALTILDAVINQVDSTNPTNQGVLESDGGNAPGTPALLRFVSSQIMGGTIRAVRGGQVKLFDTQLDDVTISSDSPDAQLVMLDNGGSVEVGTQLHNGATFVLAEVSPDPNEPVRGGILRPAAGTTATLAGNGTVRLAVTTESKLEATGSNEGIVNGSGHTIAGTGMIVGSFNNAGLVVADASGADPNGLPLRIEGPNSATVTNTGVLMARNGGRLVIRHSVGGDGSGQLVAEGGRIIVSAGVDAAGCVEVPPNAFTAAPSELVVRGGFSVLLDSLDLNVRTDGRVRVEDNASLRARTNVQMSTDDPNRPPRLRVEPGSTLEFGSDPAGGRLIQTAGTLRVNGTLSAVPNDPNEVFVDGGTIGGSGTIVANVRLRTGLLDPGSDAEAVGRLSLERDLRLQGGATTRFELAGPLLGARDRIDVTGTVMLGGTLEIRLLNQFVPVAGDSFVLLTATGGISGSFANEILPPLPGNLQWTIEVQANQVVARVEAGGPTTCPEDINGDGQVDLGDLAVVLNNFGGTGTHADGDVDGDGDIDLSDLALLLNAFGLSCP